MTLRLPLAEGEALIWQGAPDPRRSGHAYLVHALIGLVLAGAGIVGVLWAAMPVAFALAFATPLARFFGPRPRGVTALFLFFLACGILGNLGYGLLHAGQPLALIGASGGVSGLAAGAARIVGGGGRIGGFRSPFVLSMGGAWIVSNLVVALTGSALTPGGAQIAWEAHLVGFASGLLLIRPFAALAGVPRA